MAKKKIYTDDELTNLGYRIAKIRTDLCGENNTLFAEKLGIAKQTASNICSGDKSVGKRTMDKILEAFPQVSKTWLVLGVGDMFVEGGNGSNISSVGNNNSNNITTVDNRLLDLLEDAARDRRDLLEIIKNLTANQTPKQ